MTKIVHNWSQCDLDSTASIMLNIPTTISILGSDSNVNEQQSKISIGF